ncbi:MAG: CoA pyrophosphatase [Pseudonocardiales bacterium]
MSHELPSWLHRLAGATAAFRLDELSRFEPPAEGGRAAAVLILLVDGPGGPEVLLIQRASTMRSHAGQPAFPGGATDPGDDGPIGTALREAAEEVGLDPASVHIIATLSPLWLPPSGFVVTPVLGWWHRPHPVSAIDPREVAAVARVRVAALVDPANRSRVRHPSGWIGPAFNVHGMLVWGFTAVLIDRLLDVAGWAQPWDTAKLRALPDCATRLAAANTAADAARDVTA